MKLELHKKENSNKPEEFRPPKKGFGLAIWGMRTVCERQCTEQVREDEKKNRDFLAEARQARS